MQAPIRFTSAVPGAIAQRQGDQQALQQFFDRNKVEKARMEQIKSLKQLAKGYGASAAQVESSSYGELQGFVQRMELERADKTREEQAKLRKLQMQQSRQAMELAGERAGFAREQAGFAREDREREKKKRQRADILARFMTSRPDPIVQPPIDAEKNILPQYRINVETPQPAPMELGPSERFRRIASDPNLDPRSKMEAMNQAKTEELMLAKLAAEQGNAALANQIKVNAEGREQTGFTQEQSIMSFDGLTIGTGENASILQGKIGDKAEAIKAKEGLNNLNSILRDLDQLIALGYKRENSRVLSDDDKEKAAQLANRVRGLIREEILGPGTVTGPEFDRLAAQVPDPTAGFDLFSAQFGEEGSKLLEQVKADLIKKVKGKYAAYGVTAGGTANPANTRQLSTGKEVEIIFDPAE
ncbi:MAG: hypothetical protein CMI15_16335 [Opitutaceae bacterium]|nr:hypothetical protein [Opitutaceae bacterium]|tara:strand:+ start:1732 stop:2976 length:1245 start_codon:yes stop_codon:yes gene_type:complete